MNQKHAPIKRYFIDPATIPPSTRPAPRSTVKLKAQLARQSQKPKSRLPDFMHQPKRAARMTSRSWFAWYSRYLATDYWRDVRAEFLGPDVLCEECGIRLAVQLHHRFYEKYAMSVLFREREVEGCLMPICYPCHERKHPHMSKSSGRY